MDAIRTHSIPTREEWYSALEIRHGRARQTAFANSTVAICGLGGLGSNIAISLARAGIGRLILIDFDRVDLTNLHRQQYKAAQIGRYKTEALAETLREIAPYLDTITHTVRIQEENIEGLLREADIICEAFDDAEAKAMLVNVVLETMPEKYLVAASGMAGLSSANAIRTRRITKHFYLCGDGVSEVVKEVSRDETGDLLPNGTDTEAGEPELMPENLGLVSSRVMVCAAHQAHMVLRILSGEYEP